MEDGDSGDEAELLNEEQLNELDTIYQRWVGLHTRHQGRVLTPT